LKIRDNFRSCHCQQSHLGLHLTMVCIFLRSSLWILWFAELRSEEYWKKQRLCGKSGKSVNVAVRMSKVPEDLMQRSKDKNFLHSCHAKIAIKKCTLTTSWPQNKTAGESRLKRCGKVILNEWSAAKFLESLGQLSSIGFHSNGLLVISLHLLFAIIPCHESAPLWTSFNKAQHEIKAIPRTTTWQLGLKKHTAESQSFSRNSFLPAASLPQLPYCAAKRLQFGGCWGVFCFCHLFQSLAPDSATSARKSWPPTSLKILRLHMKHSREWFYNHMLRIKTIQNTYMP